MSLGHHQGAGVGVVFTFTTAAESDVPCWEGGQTRSPTPNP